MAKSELNAVGSMDWHRAIGRRSVLGGCGLAAFSEILGIDPAVAAVGSTLSNTNASARAQALYRYLCSIYGSYTLTGQMESVSGSGDATRELKLIQEATGGKLPAILGLDYINPSDNGNVNNRAVRWFADGGLPTICWHWGAPDIGTGYENSKKDFDVAKALTPGTAQNHAMARDLADIADHLEQLRDRDVPILWRPFHEFSGDWFWWGKYGAAGFKALWRLMYEYFTTTRRLDNLIWVLGWAGQNVDRSYDPGRRFYDIAGADIYADDHGNLASLFAQVRQVVGYDVPICLHENGPIPDPSRLGTKADWLWFMTWHTKWISDPAQNTPDDIRRGYLSPRTLTRDELPTFDSPAHT